MLRVFLRWWLATLAILIVLVTIGSLIRYRALDARGRAAVESAAATQVTAAIISIDTHAGSAADIIASTAGFRGAASLNGRIYLCAANGLYGFDSGGAMVESYQAGRELPAAELLALDKRGTEIFVVTAGSGVLTFNGTHFRQILPAGCGQRKGLSCHVLR